MELGLPIIGASRLGRRGALALPMACLAATARAVPDGLNFRVLREGSPIGTHSVRFREMEGGRIGARSEVRIAVRIAGFTVYRYLHETDEVWAAGRLVGLSSRLDRNGKAGFAEARAEGDALLLQGSAGEARLPAHAAPLTWWRVASFSGAPLFDPRDGQPVAPRIERLAASPGQTRLRLIGGEGAEITWDAAGTWIGFATTGEDGSAVTYQRS